MRKHDATGRSAGGYLPVGRAGKWKFIEGFVGFPQSLLESPGFMRLSPPAWRVLCFLLREHLRAGGRENGYLLAPYAQVEQVGVSSRDVSSALRELQAFGIIRKTKEGERLGGRRGASHYALTWLPTADGQWPTEDFRKVRWEQVDEFFRERAVASAFKRERRKSNRVAANGPPPEI